MTTNSDEERAERQEAICRFCDIVIYLAGDEWRHVFNDSVWCRPSTATPLLDRQAAGDDDDARLDTMLKKAGISHTCHRPHDSGTTLERLARNISDLATTRMHKACVTKVRECAGEYETAAESASDKRQFAADVLRDIAINLSSLTLDQVEQEK